MIIDTYNLKAVEQITITEALKANGNNRTKTAKILGISTRCLRSKIDQYGLPKLKPRVNLEKTKILAAFKRGDSLVEITKNYSGSIFTIRQYLFDTLGATKYIEQTEINQMKINKKNSLKKT